MFTLDGNNFGDLPWHITSIENLARAQKFWPENPIITGEEFHYPFGIDMFGALFVKLGVPLESLFPITGFVCGLMFLCTLYLWGQGFAVGGFLFSGGFAGYKIFTNGYFNDYQADLAWKNLPLALYITQRGFLYAFPVGLLVFWSWRRRFILKEEGLPFWMEGFFWGSMPLFHVHTFLVLSAVFAYWVLSTKQIKEGLRVFFVAVILAAYEMLRLTDGFKRASILKWKPGWMIQNPNGPYLYFWDAFLFFVQNYGLFFPLTIFSLWAALKFRTKERWDLVIVPAAAIFAVCLFVLFAPWDWDNTKLMAWSYILALPAIWDLALRPMMVWFRLPLVVSLFLSGFVCLFSVYNGQGFQLYQRDVIEAVCNDLSEIPHESRIAIAQVHNHPVLLCGHMVVAGYAGHLWSHGIPGHEIIEDKLNRLMRGDGDWLVLASQVQARYLFWGPEEIRSFPSSTKPWETTKKVLAEGAWGRLYDLGE